MQPVVWLLVTQVPVLGNLERRHHAALKIGDVELRLIRAEQDSVTPR